VEGDCWIVTEIFGVSPGVLKWKIDGDYLRLIESG
jgi:hypothetical protein